MHECIHDIEYRPPWPPKTSIGPKRSILVVLWSKVSNIYCLHTSCFFPYQCKSAATFLYRDPLQEKRQLTILFVLFLPSGLHSHHPFPLFHPFSISSSLPLFSNLESVPTPIHPSPIQSFDVQYDKVPRAVLTNRSIMIKWSFSKAFLVNHQTFL